MNEFDEGLAQLFARNEPDADDEAFAAALRRRIAWERRKAHALAVGLAAAIVLAAGAVGTFAPDAMLYPVRFVYRLLTPELTVAAFVLGTAGIACWSRFGDA